MSIIFVFLEQSFDQSKFSTPFCSGFLYTLFKFCSVSLIIPSAFRLNSLLMIWANNRTMVKNLFVLECWNMNETKLGMFDILPLFSVFWFKLIWYGRLRSFRKISLLDCIGWIGAQNLILMMEMDLRTFAE